MVDLQLPGHGVGWGPQSFTWLAGTQATVEAVPERLTAEALQARSNRQARYRA